MESSVRRPDPTTTSARRSEVRGDERAALVARLRRLEGQARGISEMVAKERETLDVLQQFSAMMAAGREAALAFARLRLRDSLAEKLDDEATVDDLLTAIEPLLGRATRLP
ncbi:MAG: metal-sensing transcriptional repressor [Chloroflexota bacterium]|nr:metal-sensing transcriptional repressor [Chloroflexota bacterium]